MSNLKILWKQFRDFRRWDEIQYATPAPQHVKRAVILRNGIQGGTWVETGTHQGDTAEILATVADQVHTIEPAKSFFEQSQNRLKQFPNVNVHWGRSEDKLEAILQSTQGDITFWLDGHYSAGATFKGEVNTPIVRELELIGKYFSQFRRLAILIDDVRCFNPKVGEYNDYPPREFLVSWSVSCGLSWNIEHDIFIARSDRQL